MAESSRCGVEDRRFVGIDLHRRRSVVVVQDAAGGLVAPPVQIHNDLESWQRVIGSFGSDAHVVVEATYGWYWLADMLAESGAVVHLAHPLGVTGFKNRRVKNDVLDASGLADLLRMGRLPEAWIAPPAARELRELVRYRHTMVGLRSSCKAQVHSVLAKEGILFTISDLFGIDGRVKLATVRLRPAYRARVESLLGLIDHLDTEIDTFAEQIARRLSAHSGYQAIQALPGIGPVLGAVFVAEIGEVTRFARPDQLCSWAGLTPRHYESDTKVRRGRITKQGSRLVRWAAVEAVQRSTTDKIAADKEAIEQRRGRNMAKIAAARKLLTLVFYGLRDGHIRALRNHPEPAR